MNKSEQINELAAALAKAQGAIKGAAKDTVNPFFKSKYADLASVWEACRKPLSENGLAVIQTTEPTPGIVTLHTMLAHSSGQWISGTIALKPLKDDPQGIGSAATYARRYALAAIVGVAPDDDDDGNAAIRHNGSADKPLPPAKRVMDEAYRPTPKADAPAVKDPPVRDMDREYREAMGEVGTDEVGEVIRALTPFTEQPPPRVFAIPPPKATPVAWKSYGQALVAEAAKAPDKAWLTAFQVENGDGIRAIRQQSEAAHQWLAAKLNEIDAKLGQKAA